MKLCENTERDQKRENDNRNVESTKFSDRSMSL